MSIGKTVSVNAASQINVGNNSVVNITATAANTQIVAMQENDTVTTGSLTVTKIHAETININQGATLRPTIVGDLVI